MYDRIIIALIKFDFHLLTAMIFLNVPFYWSTVLEALLELLYVLSFRDKYLTFSPCRAALFKWHPKDISIGGALSGVVLLLVMPMGSCDLGE